MIYMCAILFKTALDCIKISWREVWDCCFLSTIKILCCTQQVSNEGYNGIKKKKSGTGIWDLCVRIKLLK